MIKESDFLISNQEIFGGLKAAVNRGESLKDAMMTFYQAGYGKFEIEEAARAYLNQSKEKTNPQTGMRNIPETKEASPKTTIAQKTPITKISPTQKPSIKAKTISQKKIESPQIISKYELHKKNQPPKGNVLTIVLILALLVLLGVLAAIFLFKSELIDFINTLFG